MITDNMNLWSNQQFFLHYCLQNLMLLKIGYQFLEDKASSYWFFNIFFEDRLINLESYVILKIEIKSNWQN